MGSRKAAARRPPLVLRLLLSLIRLTWRLPFALLGALLWLIAWPFRRRSDPPVEWPTADAFYRSQGWRKLRIDALEANREHFSALTCECCLTGATRQWHVDHIHPRSSRPDLALDITNLQVLCEDCNRGKGTRYATDWRFQEPG